MRSNWPKFEPKLEAKIKELKRGVWREEKYLEKELWHKVWCVHSKRWMRTRRKKLMPVSSLPICRLWPCLLGRVGQVGHGRPKMKDENEEEDGGVEEGELRWKKVFEGGVATQSLV